MRKNSLFLSGAALAFFMASQALAGSGQALKIIVSKDQQHLVVYEGANVIAESNVSTGKQGHSTPSGIFSILEKKKKHFSNLYDDAPMPWMQRITWSGVALHESNHVPSYPASHGCVRMPRAFAKELFSLTERGAHVIITDEPVVPTLLSGSALFVPRSNKPILNDVSLRSSININGEKPVEIAMNDAHDTSAQDVEPPREPIYILITRKPAGMPDLRIQQELFKLGFDPGPFDGVIGRKTRDAIADFRRVNGLSKDGGNDVEFRAKLLERAGLPPEKNGILKIRQKFKEIYQAEVTIRDSQIALGTHFMEANNVSIETGSVEWYGMTLDNHILEQTAKRLGISDTSSAAFNSPVRALERIEIPEAARKKVETLLSEGSSLTITDTGHQRETGLGTNFVTITRKTPAAKG